MNLKKNLVALSRMVGSGLITMTDSGAFTRSITSNSLSITNGDGVDGDIQIETSGLPSGNVNPGSPSANDLFFREDLGLLIYYDGSRWLTVNEYSVPPASDSTAFDGTNTAPRSRYFPVDRTYGVYLTRILAQTFVDTTNSGAAYYTCTFTSRNSANVATTIATWSTQSDSPSVWVDHSQTINSVVDAAAFAFILSVAKTGAPGVLYIPTQVYYRLVIT